MRPDVAGVACQGAAWRGFAGCGVAWQVRHGARGVSWRGSEWHGRQGMVGLVGAGIGGVWQAR